MVSRLWHLFTRRGGFLVATQIWLGGAQKVAQVNTVTPTAANNAVYTITINSKTVTYTADGSATVAEITAGLVTAFRASTEPEFQEVTATDSTTYVTLTAATPGKPFTQTSSSTAGSLLTATATASAGPNHWGTAANWSTGSVPVDADDVIIGAGNVSILWDLDQSTIDLASFTVMAAYTGQIGNPDYADSYRQYRETYLKLGTATTVDIGLGDGPGSSLIRLHTGSNATTLRVWKMGSPTEAGLPALQLQGSHASNVLNAYSGTIGLAVNPGETAQFPTINAGYETSQSSDVQIICGSGCTLGGTITQSGGIVDATTATTTWSISGGDAILRGTATLTTLNLDGGTMTYRSSGTLTTANVGSDGTLDFSRDLRSRTVTNCYASAGARVLDPFKTVTFSNGVKCSRSGLQSGTRTTGVILDLGEHLTITPSSY